MRDFSSSARFGICLAQVEIAGVWGESSKHLGSKLRGCLGKMHWMHRIEEHEATSAELSWHIASASLAFCDSYSRRHQ